MTSETGNLPEWNGADAVYQRCAVIADHMAKNGHVKAPVFTKGGRIKSQSFVSEELEDLIAAMDRGDEEYLKDVALRHKDIWLEKETLHE